MRNWMMMLCLLLPAFAQAADGWRAQVPDAQLVGEGRFSMLFWDVYDASLYAPNGAWEAEKPFALRLQYLRELDGVDIADRSAEEMRKAGMNDEIRMAAWHTQMRKIFPNVRADTELVGVAAASGATRFYHDGALIGEIADADFGRWFFGIWLAPTTTAPDLRRVLLGQN